MKRIATKEIVNDIVYKKCASMSSSAYARVFAPSRKHKVTYRKLENPFGFSNTGDFKWFLYDNFYNEIKQILEDGESPSIDRLDSSIGYTKDNIQVISHRLNSGLTWKGQKEIKIITLEGKILILNSIKDVSNIIKVKNSTIANWLEGSNKGYKKYFKDIRYTGKRGKYVKNN